jgi:hypothetical protein
VQLICANVFRPKLVGWRVEVPGEVRHGLRVRTDRLLGIVPQSEIIDHSLTQFRHERTPMMVCLLQSCRAVRGRPTGGSTRPQSGKGFAFARFPLSQSVFGTARSGQGRALSARRRKIFSEVEKIFRSAPLTARTVLEYGAEGKAGRGSRGRPPGGVRGSAPRTLPRAFGAA